MSSIIVSMDHGGLIRLSAILLPGEDSNLQPTDYPLPEVSLGRGLSHCLGASPRYRHWALSL